MDRLQSHQQASSSGRPPQSLFFQYPVCGGTVPLARWAHAAVAVGSLVYIYGGVGSTILDDLVMLDTDVMVWRSLSPSALRARDRPEKLHAAAMAATGRTLWLFGGQQGRKFLRSLHSLDTESLVWKLHTPAGAQPSGRAGHSLTAVEGNSMYLFGGQGKRVFNDLYLLRSADGEWMELKARGRVPPARNGHSMCWDGGDRLLCFGGTTSGTTDSSLFVYSISRNEWVVPESSGSLPTPRTAHAAVMLPGNRHMLVYGGCNAQGVFFNDTYLLDLSTFSWSRPRQLNPAPPPRYNHCCLRVGDCVLMYGGVNPQQSFDSVVMFETSFGSDLDEVAEELYRMSLGSAQARARAAAGGGPGPGAAGGAAAAGGQQPLVSDLMKLQLRDLLVKRNMEELQLSVSRKAEEGAGRVAELTAEKTALQKELMAVKLVAEEAEASGRQLREELAETNKKLAREAAEGERVKAGLKEAQALLGNQSSQLAEGRRLLDSVSAELGILSSRLHRVQQENGALRAARRQQQQQGQQGGSWEGHLGVSRGSPTALSPRGSPELGPEQQEAPASEMLSCSSGSSSSSSMEVGEQGLAGAAAAGPGGQLSLEVDPRQPSDSSSGLVVLLCPHGRLDSSCLVCICQRYLQDTVGPSSVLPSTAAGSAAVGGTGSTDAAQQYKEFLGMSELARNRLEAENSKLHSQLEAAKYELSLSRQQSCKLEGSRAALSSSSLEELRQLEGQLEGSLKVVRELVLERMVADTQQKASAESLACMVCMEGPRCLVFNCGHQACEACGTRLASCPFCRQPISTKIRLFGM